jgi:geranylgeranyl diphosphate synthase type I
MIPDLKKEIDKALSEFIFMNKVGNVSIDYGYGLIEEYSQGGKRLRPLSLLLSYMACGGKGIKKIMLHAVSIELYHTYTLILDDIMDEDELRRGKPTVYKRFKDHFLQNFSEKEYSGSLFSRKSSRFSASQGILFGNLTATLSRMAMHRSEFVPGIKEKCQFQLDLMDKDICHGQSRDIMAENEELSEKEYLELVSLKTGALFAYPLKIGAILASVDETRQQQLYELGMNLGVAFQLQDDLLDLTESKGHGLGSDLRKGKKTLIRCRCFEAMGDKEKRFIAGLNPGSSMDEIKRGIGLIISSGAVGYVQKIADIRYEESKKILSRLNLDAKLNSEFLEMLSAMGLQN